MTRIVAIDPGKKGAIAELEGRNLLSVHRTPVMGAKGKEYDLEEMWRLLSKMDGSDLVFMVEEPIAMPRQAPQTTLSQGMGYGVWLGIIAAFQRPLHTVSPNAWKRKMGLSNGKLTPAEKKKAAIAMAMRLCPGNSALRHDGCAEAYLLGLYFFEHVLHG